MEKHKTPLIILGVLAAGAITYFAFFRKKGPVDKSKTSDEVKGSKTSADMKKNRQINFI